LKAPQPFPDLRRAPAGAFLLEPHDQRLDLDRQLVGVAVGAPATIGQPVQATVLVAIEDLVARLPGDIEFATQRGHLLPGEEPGHEPKALVHLATLLPRHFALLAKA
jgi:hypothetical protein